MYVCVGGMFVFTTVMFFHNSCKYNSLGNMRSDHA